MSYEQSSGAMRMLRLLPALVLNVPPVTESEFRSLVTVPRFLVTPTAIFSLRVVFMYHTIPSVRC